MVTLDASWTGALRKVGELELPDHHLLRPTDHCYFIGDYTARAGFAHSSTNGLISNLKKSPLVRNTYQWPHKLRAIREVAAAIRANLKPDRLPDLTFVPIPPSKRKTHPEYDDRMTQVARQIGPNVDVREMIVTVGDREARHLGDHHRDPAELRATLAFDEIALAPPPTEIILIDDVLTTGCSYVVCEGMLKERFPNVAIWGLFVARRVPQHLDFADFFDDIA